MTQKQTVNSYGRHGAEHRSQADVVTTRWGLLQVLHKDLISYFTAATTTTIAKVTLKIH